MAKMLDGKKRANEIKQELKEKVAKENIHPRLVVVLVGNDPASRVYVNGKKKDCEEIGIEPVDVAFPEDIPEDVLLAFIKSLSENSKNNGILVQLPLPRHINVDAVINSIATSKDVDCFHKENIGKIMTGDYDFLPCTPAGIIDLLDANGVEIEGKKAVVVGRSNIVGKPLSLLLSQKNATVTLCHSKTSNLKEECRAADILVCAIGKSEFITADFVKEGAVVIDVGMNRSADGKLVGDVKFDEVAPKCAYITPVPGGVGPMTIVSLLKNTLLAAKKEIY